MTGKQLRSGTTELRDTPRAGANSKTKPAARAVGAAASQAPGADSADPAMDSVSASLRRAYQTTLDEAIPDEMLDLLRKLD
jgi:hypothetical protein